MLAQGPPPSAVAPSAVFDVNALLSLTRLSDPQISPDGRTVAFVAQSVDLVNNKKPNAIYTVPLAGGTPIRLGDGDRPRWMPDGNHVLFDSNRSGADQIWIMNADGSGARQLTTISTEASGVTIAPDGKHFLFTSEVFPACNDDACNMKALNEAKQAPTARQIDRLLYRHWTTWEGARRSHLFSAQLDPAALSVGAIHDLTPGTRDVPPFSLGGSDDYNVSPDGQEVCYSAVNDPVPATSSQAKYFPLAMTTRAT